MFSPRYSNTVVLYCCQTLSEALVDENMRKMDVFYVSSEAI